MATTYYQHLDQNSYVCDSDSDSDVSEIWMGHYSNFHKILLVGEGDFSFSSCLATGFGCASNLTSTSLDSWDTVIENYSYGEENMRDLDLRGAIVVHQVDVRNMEQHPRIRTTQYDRIVFNFPHAGAATDGRCIESVPWFIECHKRLVSGFFMSARHMLTRDGEIHVTHKTGHPYDRWNIVGLAEEAGLELTMVVGFDRSYYPGYVNKKAYGSRWNTGFSVRDASTFMFCRN